MDGVPAETDKSRPARLNLAALVRPLIPLANQPAKHLPRFQQGRSDQSENRSEQGLGRQRRTSCVGQLTSLSTTALGHRLGAAGAAHDGGLG